MTLCRDSSSISLISLLQRQRGMKWEIWVQLTGQLKQNLLRNQSSWKTDEKEKHPKELLIDFSIQNTNLINEFGFQKQCRSHFSPVFALLMVSVFLVHHLLPGASWTGEMCYDNKTLLWPVSTQSHFSPHVVAFQWFIKANHAHRG